MLIDTHCHIHDSDYPLDPEETIKRAHENGIDEMICIGTDIENSKHAIEFANTHAGVYATIGVHPHDAMIGADEIIKNFEALFSNTELDISRLVAVGEIGLDYFRSPTTPDKQIEIFRAQIEFAIRHDLPVVFHVREAYQDFWKILDDYPNVRGVLHCFSDNQVNADEALKRGLFISINGISTFTKDEAQKQLFLNLPIDKIIFETDAPYLTPVPFRGKINEPAFVRTIAEFHADNRHMSFHEIASITTANAHALFSI